MNNQGIIDRIRRAETAEEVHELQREGRTHTMCSPAIKRRRVKAAHQRIFELLQQPKK